MLDRKLFFFYGSLILLSALASLLYFATPLVDSGAYLTTTYYFQGKSLNAYDEQRLLESYAFQRPMTSLLAVLIEPIFGGRIGFALLNVIFIIASTLLVCVYFSHFFKNQLLGYLSALLYVTSLPLILYGPMLLSDVSGYLIIIIGLLLIDRHLQRNRWVDHILINLEIGFFLLFREYALVLYPYYLLQFFFMKMQEKGITLALFIDDVKTVQNKLPRLLTVFVSFFPTWLYAHLFSTGTFFTGKSSALSAGKLTLLGMLRVILLFLASFHVLILFSIFGFLKDKDTQRRFFYVTVFISTLPLVLAGHFLAFLSPRMIFIMFPLLVSSGAYGIHCFSLWLREKYSISVSRSLTVCILCYALVSYLGAWLYPSHVELPEDSGATTILREVWQSVLLKLGDSL